MTTTTAEENLAQCAIISKRLRSALERLTKEADKQRRERERMKRDLRRLQAKCREEMAEDGA